MKVPPITKNIKPKSSPVKKEKKVDPELAKVLGELNRKFGSNTIKVGFTKDGKEPEAILRIPTGSLALDIALGGGIPQGRFTHTCGALSSTKTSLYIHTVKEAQKLGLVCAYFDAEGTVDDVYLKHIGVDTKSLIYSRPDGLEECTQAILDLQRSGVVHLAVLDSIEASPPTKEYESNMQDTVQMGVKPKLLGEFFRKYQAGNNRLVREGKAPFTLLATNQLREKIGSYGDPEYAPGGRSMGFTSTIELRLRRGDWITEGKGDNKEIVGQVVKFKIEKNKTYKRMQTGEMDFYTSSDNTAQIDFGNYDNFKSIVVEAVSWGLIERGGAWYYLDRDNDLKFQGFDPLIVYLRENPNIVDDLKAKILDLAKK